MEAAMPGEATLTTMAPRHRSTTDQLLAQTVQLATEVRGTLVADPTADRGGALRRLRQIAKIGELTALLGYCVAWLLVRKAVETGELTPEEGRADERRLGAMPPLVGIGPDLEAAVGPELADLDEEVRALHARLSRLDQLLDEPLRT